MQCVSILWRGEAISIVRVCEPLTLGETTAALRRSVMALKGHGSFMLLVLKSSQIDAAGLSLLGRLVAEASADGCVVRLVWPSYRRANLLAVGRAITLFDRLYVDEKSALKVVAADQGGPPLVAA